MSSVPVVGVKPNMTSVIGALLQTKGEEISQVVTEYEEKQAVINEVSLCYVQFSKFTTLTSL